MPFSLTPDYVFSDYSFVTPIFLRSVGIRLLLCDLDYTLAPKRQPEPDAALRAWMDSLRSAGVEAAIISNNRSSVRVERFCADLGIDYVGRAGKPSVKGYCEAMRKHDALPKETAMLGDKLLTDTLGAKRCGILMLMLEPKGGPQGAWNRILHWMQEPFKRACSHDMRQSV